MQVRGPVDKFIYLVRACLSQLIEVVQNSKDSDLIMRCWKGKWNSLAARRVLRQGRFRTLKTRG